MCTVTAQSPQCNPEYKERVSLQGTDLILENVTLSDSGVYTVRDNKTGEIIHACTLVVKGMSSLLKFAPLCI